MLRVKVQAGQYVVKVSGGAPTGTARTLSREELDSLRETKRLVASRVQREFVMDKE